MAVAANPTTTATTSSSTHTEEKSKTKAAPKRKKDPGVRIVGRRIYDSEHGKTCHQCRQKTMDFAASCKKMRKNDKPCTIKFCHKCLLNRYGEKAEEVERSGNWICPKCRGVCNCSFCMKKRGQAPTGILVHAAKATGFNSVLELLHHKGPEGLTTENDPASNKVAYKRKRGKENETPPDDDNKEELQVKKENKRVLRSMKKETIGGDDFENKRAEKCRKSVQVLEEEVLPEDNNRSVTACGDAEVGRPGVHKLKKKKLLSIDNLQDKENLHGRVSKVVSKPKVSPDEDTGHIKAELPQEIFKRRKLGTTSLSKCDNEDVVLPQGIPLVEVAGIEFRAEDVGLALQFLEFCRAFSKVLRIKRGQAEAVLREIARGRIGRRGSSSLIVQFHIKLLSVIRQEMGEASLSCSRSGTSWLEALGKCIRESECPLKELSLDCFNRGSCEYDNLDQTTKLWVLNFLCDETLRTGKLRSWIDQENIKFLDRKKKAQEKVIAAKKKEKDLKQKLKVDVAKAMLSSSEGVPLSISEHDDLILKIRSETEKAHAELLESVDLLPKRKERADAVRTEPLFLEGSGRAYWKLGGYSGSSSILHQEFGNWDLVTDQDKWYSYDEESEKVIEKHISCIRNWRSRENRRFKTTLVSDPVDGMKCNSNNLMFPNHLAEG